MKEHDVAAPVCCFLHAGCDAGQVLLQVTIRVDLGGGDHQGVGRCHSVVTCR